MVFGVFLLSLLDEPASGQRIGGVKLISGFSVLLALEANERLGS